MSGTLWTIRLEEKEHSDGEMSSAVKETQSTSSAVWDSPHPFKTATQTHFVEVIGSGLSSADVGQEDESTLWRGSIAEEFLTGLAPFGGYVVAIFVNAARNEVARRGLASRYPDPVSLSTTFLAPGRAGPIDIIISTLRQGGRFLVLEYVVKQKQAAQVVKLLAGSITFSNMSNEEGETDLSAVPFPDLPPKEQCSSSGWARHANQRGMWGLMTTLEPPYGEKELERKQLTRGWTKWCRWQRDGDDARTPESLSFFSDLYGMPAMSRMGSWFPTMDLQVG